MATRRIIDLDEGEFSSIDCIVVDNATDGTRRVLASSLNDGFAPLDSPVLVGTPTAPTPDSGDSSARIATTEFVAQLLAEIRLELDEVKSSLTETSEE